ncbi:MAG: excinuclease ABC subunit UvrA [Planctomycetes bacterium]|nr:excinuclease ABC subunit UvrA [Planctomycetota bacterium]
MADTAGCIRLRGVRQNNLKNLDLDLPLGKLIVITGVSGSGKSSLAFDTLYAEGQRRYVETFSAYTRQFLERMARPQADSIEGIPPAVAIDQSGAIKTSRSTVGTMTGINDYLKLAFARFAKPVCPRCRVEVAPIDTEATVRRLRALPAAAFPVTLLAPLALGGFESVDIIQSSLRAQGYLRFARGGAVHRIEELGAGDLKADCLDVVVDRFASLATSAARMADSVDQAFRLGRGLLRLAEAGGGIATWREGVRCAGCGFEFPRPTPGLFSFNTPYGACATCRGFGKTIELDFAKVVPDPALSLRDGAIRPWATPSRRRHLLACQRFCEARGIPVDAPFQDLPAAARQDLLHGCPGFPGVRGFFERLEEKKYKMHVRVLLARYRSYVPCRDCQGSRLRPEALYFHLAGKSLAGLWEMPVAKLRVFFDGLAASPLDQAIRLVIEEARSRLIYLHSVGLGYLTLGRQSRTLSGGEVERVNLTSALGASLVETLFVLDEPSIGLHARDHARLMEILRAIRDRGNTVVVVEHDPAILQAADHLIDLGPAAGAGGGEVVAQGTVPQVCREARSLTGDYLSGRRRIPVRPARRPWRRERCIRIRKARANNLKNIDVSFPLGCLVAITGVSGSGKSTLVEEVLYRGSLKGRGSRRRSGQGADGEAAVEAIEGLHLVDEVILVDQGSIGRTSRGNPATYSKIYDAIRRRFGSSPQAREAGFTAREFSFNLEGGRCPECAGAGAIDVEMQFLSDVSLPCEACGGKRFKEEVLAVRCRGLNIHQTLELTIREAMEHFSGDLEIVERLSFLDGLGLGYLRLGQPLNTLSGGESQRLKLAARVMAARREKLLFLLDEPTTGLHFADVERLLQVLDGLIERGHSVVVIEHHLDVIRAADWVIDLGPEGGEGGGEVVAAGTPEDLEKSPRSITGEWLRQSAPPVKPAAPARSQPPAAALAPASAASGAGQNGRAIRVIGARENNLRGISVDIPRDRLVVVTGMSGSGKSSLLYDIVYAEGQRRYLDCLSPYARQFVDELHRPDIDHLEGIPPTVAIEQRTTIGGRKSTVGTVTEINQFLRLLYTRAGEQHCPDCGVPVAPKQLEEIRAGVFELARGGGRLLAPAVRGKKGFHHTLLGKARRLGVKEARIDGEWVALPRDRELRLERQRAHDIDLVAGRFKTGAVAVESVRDAVDFGLEFGQGVVKFLSEEGAETVFSRSRSCPSCGRDFPEPDPRNFSFNSRHGACPDCGGYGTVLEIDPEQLLDDWNVPLESSSRSPLAVLEGHPFAKGVRRRFLVDLAAAGVDLSKPPARLPARAQKILLDGGKDFPGLRGFIEEALEELREEGREEEIEAFLASRGAERVCERCRGARLQSQWAAVKVGGLGIAEATALSVSGLRRHFEKLRFGGPRAAIARPIVVEILERLCFLEGLGLGYLGVGRRADTLSGGEAQRLRLAAQLGSNLRGACYILDEPTIGLHGLDNQKLLRSLEELRDRGNSVLVIEHDDATIARADHIIDLGPGPGRQGGQVVAQGRLEDLMANPQSATGRYFRERAQRIASEAQRLQEKEPAGPWIAVRGARLHNLKGLEARFPLGALTVVAGVSGAGKSTLVREVLERGIRDRLRGLRRPFPGCSAIEGWERVEAVREVDQKPIGRSPRSTPATYVGFWDSIRRIFASTPEAKRRGFSPSRFSFNVKGGRCERCAGQGRIKLEMNFLPDVHIDCDRCRGDRFEPETLKIAYRGKSAGEVLKMEVAEAREFFSSYGEIARSLEMLADLGLGYLCLGQASTTLSGGEAQRVKLAVELAKTSAGKVLYLLDEPTIGLHMLDVEQLIKVLRRLAGRGHAVVVIEHHLDLIAAADWVLELGPGGGEEGGNLLYQGPPAGLLGCPEPTPTGKCLRAWMDISCLVD